MRKTDFTKIEAYMVECLGDSAHDVEHVHRVLYMALELADKEGQGIDADVLIAACLLHDIGRGEEMLQKGRKHAEIGAEMAHAWLLAQDFPMEMADAVRDAVLTHSYRMGLEPASFEAKLLFDADKLDALGAIGIARSLLYKGELRQPLYTLDAGGNVQDGSGEVPKSLFQEYRRKLAYLPEKLHTGTAREMARERHAAAEAFYQSMLDEARSCYGEGQRLLGDMITE